MSSSNWNAILLFARKTLLMHIVVIILIAVFISVTHYSVDKCLPQQRLKVLSL